MLNIVMSENLPDLRFEREAEKFLHNMITFSYGWSKKDFSHFSPEAIEMIETDQDEFIEVISNMQALIAATLLSSENYENPIDIAYEINALIRIYGILFEREHTKQEKDLAQVLHDKILCLLLVSPNFISILKEIKGAQDANNC